MPTRDPFDTDTPAHRFWRMTSVAGLVAVAFSLLGATFWLSRVEAPTVAAASGLAEFLNASVSSPPGHSAVTPAAPPRSGAQGSPSGSAALSELPPVPLTEEVAPVPGVVFSIDGIEAIDGGLAAVGTPGLRFTLTVRNDTDAVVALGSATVRLYAGTPLQPATNVADPGGVPLPPNLEAGVMGLGVFDFAVPAEQRSQVRIVIEYAAGVPIVVFEGAAPR
ncbi:hypothetical protein [Cryobacterium sp. AP23]